MNVISAPPFVRRSITVDVVTNDVMLHRAVLRSVKPSAGVDVLAHSSVARPADVVVVDAESAHLNGDFPRSGDSGATILVAPEIDADVREQGLRLDAAAYVRNDEGLDRLIGVVIGLVSLTGRA